MIKSIRQIKHDSKEQVNSHFGDAFIIVFVPFFITTAINIVIGQITQYLPRTFELGFDFITQVTLSIIATYMSFKMLISHIRGENDLSFNNFFQFEKGIISFVQFRIIVSLIILAIFIPAAPSLQEMMNRIRIMVDPNAIENYLIHSGIFTRVFNALKISYGLLLVFWLVTVPFQMTPYLIVDKNLKVFEAIKLSYKITKGNYFKVLLFPFTYFFWFLLCISLIGIFYVLPLVFVGYGFLYLNLINTHEEQAKSI